MPEIRLGKYLHYKGRESEVLGIAKHSETLEKLVIYKHTDDDSIWARPLTMFLENVEINRRSIPRFKYIGE
ncbi:DUF1653 domain-containing protein [bacterium]|jgi:hypothetical protein|nr:DUF1653 domain-containing protein [bacterium]